MKSICLVISFFLLYTLSYSQRVIAVQNPSFEKEHLWYSCHFSGKINMDGAPSMHALQKPNVQGPKNHNIISQMEGAYEGISHILPSPIHKNVCYQLTFYANTDSSYGHNPTVFDETIDQDEPLMLLIFGANTYCGFEELLAPPQPIRYHQWAKHVVQLNSTQDWTHLNIYAVHPDPAAQHRYVLWHQQGPLTVIPCIQGLETRKISSDLLPFQISSSSVLSFGGITMLYEVGPKSVSIFDAKGEINQYDDRRKDIGRNPALDSILNRYRGIDYLFLVLKNKKFRTKRLSIISYLKTKYPEILAHSKIMRLTALPKTYRKEEQGGDLLIVENVNNKGT